MPPSESGSSGAPPLPEPGPKLLFDENLAPRLAASLDNLYPGSIHLIHVGLEGAADVPHPRRQPAHAGQRLAAGPFALGGVKQVTELGVGVDDGEDVGDAAHQAQDRWWTISSSPRR